MTGSGDQSRWVNKYLIEVNNDIFAIYLDFKKQGHVISAEEIKNKYTGQPVADKTILEAFDEHNTKVEELVGKDLVKATLTKYKTIRTKVAGFIVYKYKKQDIYLQNLEYNFITGF
jgi:hypothetical protein